MIQRRYRRAVEWTKQTMKLSTVGTIIAIRKLTLSDQRTVTVRVGKPRRFRGGNDDYYCPYQILGLGDEVVRYAGGVDPVQALQLALVAIGADLGALKEAKTGTLSWAAGSTKGDFGFPRH